MSNKNMDEVYGQFMTIAEIAKWVKVSPKTVTGWIRKGQLQAVRLGNRLYRVSPAAVLTFLRDHGYEIPVDTQD